MGKGSGEIGEQTHAAWGSLTHSQGNTKSICSPQSRERVGLRAKGTCHPWVLREGFSKEVASEPSPRVQPDKHGKYLGVKHRMMQEDY